MSLFYVNRQAVPLNTSNDTLTIVASANKPLRVYYAKVGGAGNSSAFNEVGLYRSSGGTTPGGSITPEKQFTSQGNASFSVYTSWANQPSLSGGPLHRFTVNSNGGIDPYISFPGGEIAVPGGGQISIRSVSGTGNAVVNLVVDELDG